MSVTITVNKWNGPRSRRFWHGSGLSIDGAEFAQERAVLVSDGRVKFWLTSQPSSIVVNGVTIDRSPDLSGESLWSGRINRPTLSSWLGRSAGTPVRVDTRGMTQEARLALRISNLPQGAMPDVDETVETPLNLNAAGYYQAAVLPASWGDSASLLITGIEPDDGGAPAVEIHGANHRLLDPMIRLNQVWLTPMYVAAYRDRPSYLLAPLAWEDFQTILSHDGAALPDEPAPPRTRRRVWEAAWASGQASAHNEWYKAVAQLINIERGIPGAQAQLRLMARLAADPSSKIQVWAGIQEASLSGYLRKAEAQQESLLDVIEEYEALIPATV